MPQLWTITDTAGTTVLHAAFLTPSIGSHPKDNGWAWNAATQKAWRIASAPDQAIQRWSGTTWVDDVAIVQADLVAKVKVEAERRKMLVRTPGSGKGSEYRQKNTEGRAAASVTAAVLNALSKPLALQQYPAAALERELTGAPLATILAGYLAQANFSDMEVLRLSAIERDAVLRIKAASSADGKRAAYAAINWDALRTN